MKLIYPKKFYLPNKIYVSEHSLFRLGYSSGLDYNVSTEILIALKYVGKIALMFSTSYGKGRRIKTYKFNYNNKIGKWWKP